MLYIHIFSLISGEYNFVWKLEVEVDLIFLIIVSQNYI